MIIRFQAIVFFLFGVLSWHGIDEAITVAKVEAKATILLTLPIRSLTEINVREI